MSGLEVVVRPVVLPNIRPAAPRVLAPEDDPERGIATLGGSGGRLIDLTYSFQTSMQKDLPHEEIERTFDVDEISQKDEDGTIHKENKVRVERVTNMKLKNAQGQIYMWDFALPPELDNVSTVLSKQTRSVVGEAISGAG